MREPLLAALSGTLFGACLAISGMTQPAKVIGFLDVAGAWDPSLAFVMGAALLVYAPAYALLVKPRIDAYVARGFKLPSATQIDARLLIGAAVFGAGWGVAGFCPGPAITSLASGAWQAVVFVAAMVAGMRLYSLYEQRRSDD